MCSCPHGTGKKNKGGPCPVSINCEKCDEGAGYYRSCKGVTDDTTPGPDAICFCKLRQCVCKEGIKTTGIACPKHGATSCESCISEFDTVNITAGGCVPRKCRCENGEPQEGSMGGCNLLKSGVDKGKPRTNCKTCIKGYQRDEGTGNCKMAKCICGNGKGAEGPGKDINGTDTCFANGNVQCISCNAGYHLNKGNPTQVLFFLIVLIFGDFYNFNI